MNYYIVDAFTDRPFGGNPAGVVLLDDADFPTENLMRLVAAELRYSETAFVRRTADAAYHVRFFTPTGEVDLCGHATVASFSLLYQLGLASGTCQLKTLAGNLVVEAGSQVMMQMASPHIVSTLNAADVVEVYHAVGLEADLSLPVQIVSTGLPDIMMPIASVAALNALQTDMDAIASITSRLGAVSIHAFALGDGHTAHVRDFAPAYGIPEESATGTANAALTYYLSRLGIVGVPAECSFLQGEAMGRSSVVNTRISANGIVYVGGCAAIVAHGEIL